MDAIIRTFNSGPSFRRTPMKLWEGKIEMKFDSVKSAHAARIEDYPFVREFALPLIAAIEIRRKQGEFCRRLGRWGETRVELETDMM